MAGIGQDRGLSLDAGIGALSIRHNGEAGSFIVKGPPSDDGKTYLRIGRPDPVGRMAFNPATGKESFTLPSGTFVSNDGRLTVQARLPGGKALPSWLRFDARTGTFTLRDAPPPGAPARLVVEVTAASADGQSATIRLTLRLSDRTAALDMPMGKEALSTSIRAATSVGLHQGGLALLNSLSFLPAGPAKPSNAA